ncbi:ABC transporter permease [Sinorhizobium sp. BG8]|uniref:ABC transporter permease n=1 Tax=Sinorhizobium sp. BG8 TaxID=2613773 RepID=UPI001FF05879|nr:ABC transporter permease [Sinorhizobium sp. BG8]
MTVSTTSPQQAVSAGLAVQRGRSFFGDMGRPLGLLLPALVLAALVMLVPLMNIIGQSFHTQMGVAIDRAFSLENYRILFSDEGRVFRLLLVRSLGIAFAATVIVILVAYPVAYFLAFHAGRSRMVWLMLITIPFWTSYLLRVFAWKIILGFNGVINSALLTTGLIEKPIESLLYSQTAVILTLVHSWAPFAVLPIYVSLEKVDRLLLDAAADLGDTPLRSFWSVTLPLSMPGVLAATLMIFIPTVGDYVTPSLVGGRNGLMIGNYISELFGQASNIPLGSAMAVGTMVIISLLVAIYLAILGRVVPRAEGRK